MRIKPSDRLIEAIQLCDIHRQRMSFAWEKIAPGFPLTIEKYLALKPETLSFFDQLIFRFSKLQNAMGNKLFPALLQNLGEDVRGKSFIDILSKLEELELLPKAETWMQLRETRNIVTHEYPFITQEVIEGLNLLGQHQKLIADILQQILGIINERFSVQ